MGNSLDFGYSEKTVPSCTLSISDNSFLHDLLGFGLMGIEAFTTWHTKEQEDHYFQFCRKNGILATYGSDFHGKNKPNIRIGQVRNNSYKVVELLKGLN